MSVLDDYLVDPKMSLLDKTRIQAQVLLPVLRARREATTAQRSPPPMAYAQVLARVVKRIPGLGSAPYQFRSFM
jgi:hypothetical protein